MKNHNETTVFHCISGVQAVWATAMGLLLLAVVGLLVGDVIVVVFAAFIVASTNFGLWWWSARQAGLLQTQLRAIAATAVDPGEQVAQLMENHLRLDEAINGRLQEVNDETEAAAMTLIQRVRKLNDAARTLLDYLDHSSMNASDMGEKNSGTVDFIVSIGNFVQKLPDRIDQDMQILQEAGREINELSNLVVLIKDVSRQTDLLALNASIVSARAGEAGRAFMVVANEVRKLSERSAHAATMIETGLAKAQQTMQSGLKFSFLEESAEQMNELTKVVESVRGLQEGYADMRQYYKTLFSVVTQHNTSLAAEIAEMLGEIQFQDVVRQRIERATLTVSRRNELFQEFSRALALPDDGLTTIPAKIQCLLDDYLMAESCHSSGGMSMDDGEPKMELF